MSRCRLTSDQQARVTALAMAGMGPAALARALGLRPTQITGARRTLIRAGRIPASPRSPWRRWTAKETDQLISLVERGMPYAHIARKLKRSTTSITVRCKRLGVRVTTTNATMSARDVARQLGIGCSKVVSRWIRKGWLRARDAGQPPRILWRVTWEDLTTFLEDESHWIAWQPDRIPDPALREWAQELRADAGPLLTPTAIARRYHVEPATVRQWINKGWLPSVHYGNHRVPESALDGWIVPCDRNVPMNQDWPEDNWSAIGRAPGATFARRRPHERTPNDE